MLTARDTPANSSTGKFLLALRCLNAALALDAQHPALHAQAIELRNALNLSLESLPAKVQDALNAEFTAVPPSADLKKLNAEYLDKHTNSAEHRIAAARAAKALGEPDAAIEKSLVDVLQLESATFDDAATVLEQLRKWKSSEAASFKEAAHEKWPEVTQFA